MVSALCGVFTQCDIYTASQIRTSWECYHRKGHMPLSNSADSGAWGDGMVNDSACYRYNSLAPVLKVCDCVHVCYPSVETETGGLLGFAG